MGCRARRRELTLCAALAVGALVSALGCAEPYEPNYLFRGEWIDIDGRGRSAEETCGGTFAYVDAYAGAVAQEFGVEGHLGDYRWYSQDRFDAELPCERGNACASPDRTVSTAYIPLEHEIAHLANLAANGDFCPGPISEGLAEYYSPFSQDVRSDGFQRVVEAFADPSAAIRWRSYGPLGRFAAYLVARFGLDAVVEVCRTSGRFVDADQLSAAFQAVLGATTAELLADFEADLEVECDRGRDYQSRVFACGVAEAAPNIGLIGDERVELRYELDCANEQTIGPDPFDDRIRIVERFDIDQDDNWWVWIEGEEVDGKRIDTSEVELILASCEPCGYNLVLPGEWLGVLPLDAGRYWFELNAPADFVGTVRVVIRR